MASINGGIILDKEWENIQAVQKMQDYIEEHEKDEITLYQLASACGYSPWHAARLFKQYIGRAPFEYIRALKLSKAAMVIRDENVKILDVALDYQFDSHEGFTRAFKKSFGISPKAYQKKASPIPLYKPYPIREEYIAMKKIEEGGLEQQIEVRGVYFKHIRAFPKRKLILKRGHLATNYFEYELEHKEACQSVWGILCSIKEALNEPMGIWLSPKYQKEGTSIYVQGVEVPWDYSGSIPEGFECIELPEQLMMIFQSELYSDDDFLEEILAMQQYMSDYTVEDENYEWDEEGYRFQLEPQGYRGYIEGRTVKVRADKL